MSGRQSGIELLRIFAAIGVVLIHIGDRTLDNLDWGSANQVIMYFIESLAHVSVDVFLIITGFFQ